MGFAHRLFLASRHQAIGLAVRIAVLADSTLIARRLAPVRHVVCANPAYLAEHGTPQSAAELAEHDCPIHANAPNPGLWAYIDPDGRQGSVQVRARLRANNGYCLRQAAEDGHGIVLEPSFIVYRSIEARKLLPILSEFQWPTIYAHAVYPRTRHLSRRVRAFVDFLAEGFAGVPCWDRCLQNGTQSIHPSPRGAGMFEFATRFGGCKPLKMDDAAGRGA